MLDILDQNAHHDSTQGSTTLYSVFNFSPYVTGPLEHFFFEKSGF